MFGVTVLCFPRACSITIADKSYSADRVTATVEQPIQALHVYDVIEDNPALALELRAERKAEVVQLNSDNQRLRTHASTVNISYESLDPDSVVYESIYTYSQPSGEEVRREEVKSTGRNADHYSSINKLTLDTLGDYAQVSMKSGESEHQHRSLSI